MRTRILIGVAVMMLMGVLPAAAATISGVVTDTSGAAMPGTRVVLRYVATRQEFVVDRRYEVVDGELVLPGGAGWGISVDRDALERHLVAEPTVMTL